MDALPMAGTEGAVGVMTTLINNKQVEGLMADAWMSTLAFVQKPTRSMIEDGLVCYLNVFLCSGSYRIDLLALLSYEIDCEDR